jgi:hypothetical protein
MKGDKKMKKPTYSAMTVALLVLLLVSFNVVQALDQPELLIQANTKLSLQLLSPISTGTSKKGDRFSCKILTPVEFAGAIVEGHVRSVKRSGKANKDSKMDLAFDSITLRDGRTANFSATVIEVFDVVNAKDQGRADNEGTIRNKSTTVKTSIKRAAVGALIGAIVGGAVAGGQGAVVGAAIGASVGVTTTLATKGPDLEFKPGTEFTVETNGPSRRTLGKSAPRPIQPTGASGAPSSNAANVIAAPSSELVPYVTQRFRTKIPQNWRELNMNPVTLGPEGAFGLNNGRPELTHGVILGLATPASSNLDQISEQFIAALLKGNQHMHKQDAPTRSSIASHPAIVNVLAGVGSQGKPEIVTVHTALLANRQFFYAIAVVPESDAESYREAFRSVLASIEFN